MAVINKYFPIHRAVVILIILLYALITISCAVNWTYIRYAFIESGQSFWTVYLRLNNLTPAFLWESGVPAFMSTVIADLYMVCDSAARESSTQAHFRFYSRFGAAGWFGNGDGLLSYFQYCPKFLQPVECPISSTTFLV